MKRLQIAALVGVMLLTGLQKAQAEIKYSDCLLDISIHQVVSLGKPLSSQRLGTKSKIRVGVLPFYFTDGKVKELSEAEKSDYLEAASRIQEVSNQNVKIEIVFLPSLNSGITSSEFRQLYLMRNVGWAERDLNKSTWGFVKRNILKADATVNFTNFDSVILDGNNLDKSFFIAEAMQFFRGSQGNSFEGANEDFYKSVLTQDGYVDNAILLDSHMGVDTIAHELLHNFGLTDLYGSGTGPGYFSMMAGSSRTLLNYEKAVLGWFPIENINCSDYGSTVNPTKVDNRITITNVKKDSVTLLKVSNDKAYIIEVVNSGAKSFLLLYLLEQDMRPPITLYTNPSVNYFSIIDAYNPLSISSVYHTNDFDLLVSDFEGLNLDLNIVPKNLVGSPEALALYEKSRTNKQNQITIREAADKAAADKAAADKAAADKAKLPKKVTITCIKGKLVKKITAVSPICPTGYRKK